MCHGSRHLSGPARTGQRGKGIGLSSGMGEGGLFTNGTGISMVSVFFLFLIFRLAFALPSAVHVIFVCFFDFSFYLRGNGAEQTREATYIPSA